MTTPTLTWEDGFWIGMLLGLLVGAGCMWLHVAAFRDADQKRGRMTTLTCDHCKSEIDVAKDPKCLFYEPSGATQVMCVGCREAAYDRWEESALAEEDDQRRCEALREAYMIKRGWA